MPRSFQTEVDGEGGEEEKGVGGTQRLAGLEDWVGGQKGGEVPWWAMAPPWLTGEGKRAGQGLGSRPQSAAQGTTWKRPTSAAANRSDQHPAAIHTSLLRDSNRVTLCTLSLFCRASPDTTR